jgi:hypothetical protein
MRFSPLMSSIMIIDPSFFPLVLIKGMIVTFAETFSSPNSISVSIMTS